MIRTPAVVLTSGALWLPAAGLYHQPCVLCILDIGVCCVQGAPAHFWPFGNPVLYMSVMIYNKRSKNIDKRPHHMSCCYWDWPIQLLHAVTDDWFIPLAVYTTAETLNVFEWAGQPPKLHLPLGDLDPIQYVVYWAYPSQPLPNGISNGSAVVAGLMNVINRQTDSQTDRPRYSIRSNRQHLCYSCENRGDGCGNGDIIGRLLFVIALCSFVPVINGKWAVL